jgi:hypothetical protein
VQPANILNRQLNQIHIVNKQHHDLRPVKLVQTECRDHYEQKRLEQETKHRERTLRIMANKDKYNELTSLGGKLDGAPDELTVDYQVQAPQAARIDERQRMVNRNFNLRNMQQIVANFSWEDTVVPDMDLDGCLGPQAGEENY